MIILGRKYQEIIDYVKPFGFNLNTFNVSNHKNKHLSLYGSDINKKFDEMNIAPRQALRNTVETRKMNDMSILDRIIQMANENLETDKTVNSLTAIRAMEEKRKQTTAEITNAILAEPTVKAKIMQLFQAIFAIVGRYVDGPTLDKIRIDVGTELERRERSQRIPQGSDTITDIEAEPEQ